MMRKKEQRKGGEKTEGTPAAKRGSARDLDAIGRYLSPKAGKYPTLIREKG